MIIKFRGAPDREVSEATKQALEKAGILKDGFVYGFYQKTPNRDWIIAIIEDGESYTEHSITVVPESVSQFIGRVDNKDSNKEIYAGDILRSSLGGIGLVKFHPSWCAFCYSHITGRNEYNEIVPMIGSKSFYENEKYEIVGSSYYNPELLKKG